MIMKKFILAIIILGIVSTITACKKNTDDTSENIGSTAVETSNTADTEENIGNTAAETSESAEAATYEPEPMETVDNLQIELEEGQEGEVAPD